MKKTASGILPMIALDRTPPKALYMQIYEAFRRAIVEGNLRAGQRVPSTRVLAAELGVSRLPVLTAYSQLLAEGYFESHVGSGTVISNCVPLRLMQDNTAGSDAQPHLSGVRPLARRASVPSTPLRPTLVQGFGAFNVGEIAFDQFPVKIWSSLISHRARDTQAQSLHYGEPMGLLALREEIANYLRMARSVRCEAEQIMIVSGSQQALDISGSVLVDPGSAVWIEDPGYRLARDVFSRAGCRLIPVPVDNQGMDVSAGIRLCRKARVAVVTPSHQFPLGVTMSAKRRLELLDWAQSTGGWIIEDDYDSEYRYDSSPIASLQGLDGNARVIYIGTFSKVLFPSLRLGYVVVPRDLVDHFVAARRFMDYGPPLFFQAVTTDFIHRGHFARHLRRMRTLYQKRRSVLVESIKKELGSTLTILGSEAGMHLTATLQSNIRDTEIAARGASQNLWIWPLSSSYLGSGTSNGFILGFANTAESDIPPAVRKLRNVLKQK
jgi:GntR family transcriptional regulator/MocR family aminotransferase